VAIEGRAAQVSLLCQAQRFAAARDLAQATLARDPYSPRGHCALGEALAGLGQDAPALQAYGNAVRADPNDPVAIRGWAQLHARLGRLPEAINAYRRLVGPGRGALEDVVALATLLRKAGDVEGAKRVLEEVAKRDPHSLEPLRQEAEARAAAGDLQQAGALLEKLLARERPPHPLALALAESLVGRAAAHPPLLLICARTFAQAGRPLAAVRLLVPLLQRAPQSLDVRRALGLAYARLGAGPLAEEQLLQVVNQRDAGADEFLALGEVYLERGDVPSGVKALTRARDARPSDAEIHRALARALALQGDLDGALRELKSAHQGARETDQAALEDELDRLTERAFGKRLREVEARLRQNPEDTQARLDLAQSLARRGDLRDALSHLVRAAKDEGARGRAIGLGEQLLEEAQGAERREVVLVLARVLVQNDDAPRAAALLDEQLQAAPDDPELQLLRFEAWIGSQRVQEAAVGLSAFLPAAPPAHLAAAMALAERVVADHGYVALALPLARAHRHQGAVEAAARSYARYLEAEGEDAEVRREYALLLEGAGKPGEAYAALRPLVEGTQGSVTDLEHVAGLAQAAGDLEQAVALLQRAADRAPEDLALKQALEGAEARLRESRIAALAAASTPEDKLKLAALHAEAGHKDQTVELLRALGRLGENPELDYLRFCGEQFARAGKTTKAEEVMRGVARTLNYAAGSEQAKALLYRMAGLYERAHDRRNARRVYLELFQHDARYRDVEARLDALQDDVVPVQVGQVDERMVELVDAGAPLGTIFDALMSQDLALDPKLLAQRPGG
jgi:predicted Zn-dependent protease